MGSETRRESFDNVAASSKSTWSDVAASIYAPQSKCENGDKAKPPTDGDKNPGHNVIPQPEKTGPSNGDKNRPPSGDLTIPPIRPNGDGNVVKPGDKNTPGDLTIPPIRPSGDGSVVKPAEKSLKDKTDSQAKETDKTDEVSKEDDARDVYKNLAKELAAKKDFLTSDDVKKLISGEIKESDLLASKLRQELRFGVLLGMEPKDVVDTLNKHLKDMGADFQLKISPTNFAEEGFHLDMVDAKTGKLQSEGGIRKRIFVSMEF